MGTGRFASALALAALTAGCFEAAPPRSWHAGIALPALPFWDNPTIAIDEAQLAEAGDAYCDAHAGAADSAEFFLGELPLRSLDALCPAAGEADDPAASMGALYLSGYFGGLWLADVMGSMGGPPGGGEDRDPRDGFFNLVADVQTRMDAARDRDGDEVIAFAEGEVGFLLLIYGYNKGYLEVALENPPPGLTAPDDLLRCQSFLDCTGPGVVLHVLDRFAEAQGRLADPPDRRWKEMARSADGMAATSVDMGRSVWEGILDETTIAAGQYDMLLALSLGYLLAAEAAVLGVMTAYADQDAEAGRCAIPVDAGLFTWSNAYFAGLRDSASATAEDFPVLGCARY